MYYSILTKWDNRVGVFTYSKNNNEPYPRKDGFGRGDWEENVGYPTETERDAKYDELIANQTIKGKADKGQEVENAIELNDSIKYYIKKLIRLVNFDLYSNLLDIAKDNTNIAKQTEFNNNMKLWKAYGNMLDNVEEFERNIAIALNKDPSHPITWLHERDFVNILSHIKQSDAQRYAEITKMLGVEATYEPELVKEEYKKLQTIINEQLHSGNPIDPNIVNGKDTLAHELGGN